jgi:PhoH-like ATPase
VSSASPTRTYVIDTSVLLSDPQALRRFAEHDVVLPVVVITELEAKRHHSELGYFARGALRILDELRSSTTGWTRRSRSTSRAEPSTSS